MRNKNFILLLLLLTTILLISFGIMPGVKKIRQDKQTITKEMAKTRELLAQGQDIIKNKNSLSAVESELFLIEAASLQGGQELDFITDLEKTAARNNVEQTISFNNLEVIDNANDAKTIPIAIQLTGGIKEIMNYINDLEKFDYYINITKINLAANGKGSGARRAGERAYQDEENNEIQTEQPATVLSANLYGLTYWK